MGEVVFMQLVQSFKDALSCSVKAGSGAGSQMRVVFMQLFNHLEFCLNILFCGRGW